MTVDKGSTLIGVVLLPIVVNAGEFDKTQERTAGADPRIQRGGAPGACALPPNAWVPP